MPKTRGQHKLAANDVRPRTSHGRQKLVKIALGPASSYTAARPMPEPGRGEVNFRARGAIYVRIAVVRRCVTHCACVRSTLCAHIGASHAARVGEVHCARISVRHM